MTPDPENPPATAPARRTRMARAPRINMPREHINRQGAITHLAFALLGGRDAAVTFLNTFNAGLGAMPLLLAGGSKAGYESVHGELLRLSPFPQGAAA